MESTHKTVKDVFASASRGLSLCAIGFSAAFFIFYEGSGEPAVMQEDSATTEVATTTIPEQNVSVTAPEGALDRPPAIETSLELDTHVYDPPDPVEVDIPTTVQQTAREQTDVTQLDLTWKPGEFIRKVCVAKFNGISTLCVVTTVGVLVDGSEDLVYEASESNPMQIGTQLLVDNPASDCQDVASCISLLGNDEESCRKVLSDIRWLSWQLGINASYNNGIPGLEAYPESWVQPVFFDASGSNLRVDITEDCTATATQV